MSYTIPSLGDRRNEVDIFDDFLIAGALWTDVNDGATGTDAVLDAAGGILSIATAGADNDYHYYVTVNEVFKPAPGKPLRCQARLSLTEANTDDANIVFGVSSVVDGTLVADNGGGLTQANPGILITKVDGGTSWIGAWSDGTTKKTATLGSFTSGSYVNVGFYLNTSSSSDTHADLIFFVGTTEYGPYRVALSGGLLTEMHGAVGVKAGGSSAETLLVDFVHFNQAK